MRAALLGEADVVNYLIGKGADVNARDEQGRTALMEAVNAYKQDVISALIDAGADINAGDNRGCTALMRAAYIGYPELVKYLLSKSADKNQKDYDGNLPIHYVRKECLADLKGLLKAEE